MENIRLTTRPFDLASRDVHIWPVSIEPSNAVVDQFRAVLTPEERTRCAQFQFDNLQRAFVLSRGISRVLLGRYTDMAPGDIQFHYGPNGKPTIAAPTQIKFNVSRSGALALFAFTLGCEIGVDTEQVRPLKDIPEIASRFFCAEEAAELMSLSQDERERAFFRCWTRKEAYIKAVGEGLSAALSEFRVTLLSGEPARFIHFAHDAVAASTWTLHDLNLATTHAAALTYRDAPRPLHVQPLIDPAKLFDVG